MQTGDPKEPNRQALADLPIQTGDPKEPNRQALADLTIQTGNPKKPNRKALSDLTMQTTIRQNQKEKHFPFCPSRSEGVKFASACEFAITDDSMDSNRKALAYLANEVALAGIILEQEAKSRQKEHGETAPGKKSLMANLPGVIGAARQEAANIMKVNARYVSDAKQIQEAAPERFMGPFDRLRADPFDRRRERPGFGAI